MQYRNATHVLPDELLKEVQKYADGEAIYIPKLQEKKKWGEGSGARRFYEERNEKIRQDFKKGIIIDDLSEKYGLSAERVKRIVYKKEKRE
jgi:Mor family transcriptional regulator